MTSEGKLRVHGTLAALTFTVGAVLMAIKIYADSEPGAIPLVLVLTGIGWYVATRVRRARRR